MFVRQNGTYECSLSGGCLEPTVAEAAARVIASGEPVIVSYDLADDSIWGLGIGCSGAVDILIERLEDDAITRAWLTILERAEPAVLVTSALRRLGTDDRRAAPASLPAGCPMPSSNSRRSSVPVTGCARRTRHLVPSRSASAELFFEITMPPPDLVIFGAGHDAAPVARLAWTLGFAVTVVDVREAFLAPDRFPDATLVCAHFSQFADRVKPRAGAFMLVMNHHVERDQESLRFSLESDAAYIGVLGPRSRYEKLLAGLAAQATRPMRRSSHACAARSGFRWAPKRRTRWRCRSWGRSWRFAAGSKAASSAARSAAFTDRKTVGFWPARSPQACRHRPADPAETAGSWSGRCDGAGPSGRRAGARRARGRTPVRKDAAAPSPRRTGR